MVQITKREYLWFDGDNSFHLEPSTYVTVYYLFGWLPVWVSFRDEWPDR